MRTKKFKSFGDITLEPGDLVSGERKTLLYNIFQVKIHLLYPQFYNVISSGKYPFTVIFVREKEPKTFLCGEVISVKSWS